MLIKLNYNTNKTVAQAFRAVNEIINTTSITSASALSTTATNAGWGTDILTGFDVATSYIYRTKDTTGVVSHMARSAIASGSYAFDMMIEYPTYDNSAVKQYQRIYSTSTTSNLVIEQYGATISNPINSTVWSPSIATSTTTSQGTVINFTGTPSTVRTLLNTTSTLTTLWVYITPTSMVWCAVLNNGTFQPSGWYGTNSSYSTISAFSGPHIYSQYKRYDYWNTVSTNILPFIYMNSNSATNGFLTNIGDLGIVNTNSTSTVECPFMAFNYINAVPGTGTTFPVVYAPRMALGIGTRYSDTFALTGSNSSAVNPTDPCYGAVINTSTVQTRIPSTDLLTKGFAILPITVRNQNINMLGGSVSDVGDFYLFNGDYFPGDEFAYAGRTYVIFPVGLGYTTRIGLAIPKE